MVFEVAIENPKKFVDVITGLADAIDEVAFKFNEDGLKILTMDASRVILFDIEMDASDFVKYNVEEETVIGVDLNKIKKILKRAKKDDVLIFRDDGSGFFEIIFDGKNGNRKFKVGKIDVDEMELEVPELPFQGRFVVESRVFKEIIKDAKVVSDTLAIIMLEDERVKLKASSETSNYEVEIGLEDEGLIDIEVDEVCKSSYGIAYLESLVKLMVDEVSISIGNDMPMKVEGKLGDNSKVIVLLAPRVEE